MLKSTARLCVLWVTLAFCQPLAAADFWQDSWVVPDYAEGNTLLIRPIKASDANRLFHSYMTSQKWLYQRLGWAWPSEKSTLDQNKTMVNYHIQQAREHTAFTFVVVDKRDDSIVGAVYMVPVADRRQEKNGVPITAYNAEVSWWLLKSAVNDNLHNNVFSLLTHWLENSWPWRQVLFPVSEKNTSAVQVLESSSARLAGRDLDAKEKYFSYAISRK